MAHPISPLVRSQTNLELVSTGNARQALLPTIEFSSHGPGSGAEKNDKLEMQSNGNPTGGSNSTSIQTLQISRRPSLLLHDILARRPSALFRGKKEANGHAPKSPFGYRFKHVRHAIHFALDMHILLFKSFDYFFYFFFLFYLHIHTNICMVVAQSVTSGHRRHLYGHNQHTW